MVCVFDVLDYNLTARTGLFKKIAAVVESTQIERRVRRLENKNWKACLRDSLPAVQKREIGVGRRSGPE